MQQPQLASPKGASSAAYDHTVVLVVDDDVDVADALTAFLSARGLEVCGSNDPREALLTLDRMPSISVVVSDLRMPGMDGLTFAAEAQRRRAPSDALAVILITAHATAESAEAATKGGIFAFMQKPFHPQRLVETIRDAHLSAMARREPV